MNAEVWTVNSPTEASTEFNMNTPVTVIKQSSLNDNYNNLICLSISDPFNMQLLMNGIICR